MARLTYYTAWRNTIQHYPKNDKDLGVAFTIFIQKYCNHKNTQNMGLYILNYMSPSYHITKHGVCTCSTTHKHRRVKFTKYWLVGTFQNRAA